jgi:glucosamine-6-phosphate deaminase
MRLTIRDTKEEVGSHIADYIVRRINKFVPTEEHPNFVLGLPTGSSPLPVYRRLVELYKEGKVSFKVSFSSLSGSPSSTALPV